MGPQETRRISTAQLVPRLRSSHCETEFFVWFTSNSAMFREPHNPTLQVPLRIITATNMVSASS